MHGGCPVCRLRRKHVQQHGRVFCRVRQRCGGRELDPNIKATLTFATWDNEAIDFYEELDLEGRFQELYPNVDLEIEEFKDDVEYFNQMKIRASANELPDLMYLQTRYFLCTATTCWI